MMLKIVLLLYTGAIILCLGILFLLKNARCLSSLQLVCTCGKKLCIDMEIIPVPSKKWGRITQALIALILLPIVFAGGLVEAAYATYHRSRCLVHLLNYEKDKA